MRTISLAIVVTLVTFAVAQVKHAPSLGEHLQAKGLRLSTGTIVDATIINAPSSPRTRGRSGIRRCTGRARASSGTSG
jgi:hypothetical protein